MLLGESTASKADANPQNGTQAQDPRNTQHHQGHDRYRDFGNFIPLPELVRADEELKCPEGLLPVPQTVNRAADNQKQPRKIPKIVHHTGEVGCLTPPFHKNSKDWTFEGHSFYFHDALSRTRLLEKFWFEFPHLQLAFQCLKNAGGAGVADLWRYVALWEYGGVFVDMDSEPGPKMNADTITADMDGFFLKTGQGANGQLSQYFIAVSPKHPMMFLAVYDVLEGMLALEDVGNFKLPQTTGPDSVARAFLKFIGIRKTDSKERIAHYVAAPAGPYHGIHNRSVTVVGNRTTEGLWVNSNILRGAVKQKGYALMGMSNYHALNKFPVNKTCLQVVLEHHQQQTIR